MTCPKCGRRNVPKRPDKTRHCRRCGPLQTYRHCAPEPAQ